MKLKELKILIQVLSESNPDNFNINNKGLASLGPLLFYPKEKDKKNQKEALKLISENFENPNQLLQSLKEYHFSSYYTPLELINYQINYLKQNNIKPKKILEPSSGNGAYVIPLAKAFPNAEIVAIEPDILSYKILKSNTKNFKNVKTLNKTFEDFIAHDNPKDFELTITNTPFGDFNIKNSFSHNLPNSKLRNVNLFFNTYMPLTLKEGGLSMSVTSKGFMDRENLSSIRTMVLENANFIDAIRFNNQLFKDEKTKVVADLIILQKTNAKNLTKNQDFITSTPIQVNENQFYINQHFSKNLHKINGKIESKIFHNRPDLSISPTSKTNQQFLESYQLPKISLKLNQTTPSITKQKTTKTPPITVPKPATNAIHDEPKTIEKYTFQLNSDSTVYFNSNDNPTKPIHKKYQLLVGSYIILRDEYIGLINAFKNTNTNSKALLSQFDSFDFNVNSFHFQYGFLKEHKELLMMDKYFSHVSQNIEKASLTNAQNNQVSYSKNPSFTYENLLLLRTKKKNKEPLKKEKTKNNLLPFQFKEKFPALPETKNKSLKELVYDYFDTTGTIKPAFLEGTLKRDLKDISKQALEEKIFYYTIDENNQAIPVLYHKFASGDISEKIKRFKNNNLPEYIDATSAIAVLESLKNKKLSINEIAFNFESPFIPNSFKKDFFKYLINENVELVFTASNNKTFLVFKNNVNQDADLRYSVKINNETLYNYKKILQNFADNVYPTVIYTTTVRGNRITKIHQEATTMAKNLYEELQLQFKDYITSNITFAEQVEQNYYDTFLNTVNVNTNSDILKFPKSLVFEPYKHQKRAVLYGIIRETALFDHKVGHGKSLTMGMLAYKKIQHKTAEKILITTLGSVAPQLHKEIKENFPMFNTFLLTSKNFNKKTRPTTLRHIANTNYDIIVGEHTHLQRLPKSIENIKEILESKIDDLSRDLETAKKFGLKETKRIVGGLIKRQNNLRDKLHTILQKIEKNTTEKRITLQELGIDCLMIDECHKFKNIGYTTRHRNVSGLNNNTDSITNLDLEISIRSIHNRIGKDKNIFFFSGTPIKNSVTELYAYQRYLVPHELEKMKTSNFDAWASIFLKQDVQIESNVFGQPRMHKRFRYFTNLPELSKIYHSFTHISNNGTFRTNDIRLLDKFIPLNTTPAYDDLKTATIELSHKKQLPLYGIKKYSKDALKSSYILALNVSRNVLVDPLIETHNGIQIPFDETDQIKIHRLLQDVKKRYDETSKDKGVCLIFSNLGVYNKSKNYNTYDTLKNILVHKHGIPAHEIDFAQLAKDEKRMHLFQKNLRNGTLRIAIGSTQTLGTGTNIQNKITGIFNLDIPWSPDDFEQRLGRGIRKGNLLANTYGGVQFYTYGYKDTTDIFSYSLNKHKSVFINQIKQLNHSERTFDDLLSADSSEWTHEQREAVLIGDMDTFKLVKLNQDLTNLEAEKKMFDIRRQNAQKSINFLNQTNKQLISDLNQIKKQNSTLKTLVPKMQDEATAKQVQQLVIHQYQKIYKQNPSLNPFLKAWNELPNETPTKARFESLNKILLQFALIPSNKNNTTILNLPSNSALKFNVERLEKPRYFFSLEISPNIQIKGKRQYKFDTNKIAYQLLILIKQLPQKIDNTNFVIDQNLKNIASNKKSLNTAFPAQKMDTINAIKKDIKKIKTKSRKR